MKSCFDSHIIITQRFGDDFIWDEYYPKDNLHESWKGKYYYKDILGIKGHNGLDVIPSSNDNKIYSILTDELQGVIIYSNYVKGYGNRVGIWYKEKGVCEFHNHLAFINRNIKIGQILYKRTYIGKMGNTGIKNMGYHNHLAFCYVDDKCRRTNYNNGYRGWVDPLPFLS